MYSNINNGQAGESQLRHEAEALPGAKSGRRFLKRVGVLGGHDLTSSQQPQPQYPPLQIAPIDSRSGSSYYSSVRGAGLRQQYPEGAGTAPSRKSTITAPRRSEHEFSANGSTRGSESLFNMHMTDFAGISAPNRPDASLVTASTASNNGAAAFLSLDGESAIYPQNPTTIGSTGAPQQLIIGADNKVMLAPLGRNLYVLPTQSQSQQVVYLQDPAPAGGDQAPLMNLVVGAGGPQYVSNIEAPSIYNADDQHGAARVILQSQPQLEQQAALQSHRNAISNQQLEQQAALQSHRNVISNQQLEQQAALQSHRNAISNQQLQQLSLRQQARTTAAAALQNQRMQVTRLLLEERQRQVALYSPYLQPSTAQDLLLHARLQGDNFSSSQLIADARSIGGISHGHNGSFLNGMTSTSRAEIPLSRSQVSTTASQRSEVALSTSNNSVKDESLTVTDKPRRPLSSYNFFFSEERERILAELKKNTESSKEKDSENGKKKESSREDIDKFLEAPPVKFSEEERKELEDRIRAKTNQILSINLECERPKKPPHRRSHGMGLRPLSNAIAVRWRNLSGEKRKFYDKLAKQDLRRYKKSMKDCSLKLSSHYKKK